MRKVILLIAIAMLAVPLVAFAYTPIVHAPVPVYQAYPGISTVGPSIFTGPNRGFSGYVPFITNPQVISSVPGILQIIPGSSKWTNFINATQQPTALNPFGGGLQASAITIKNVNLVKTTPALDQAADVFPAKTVIQLGTPNIRLWWPLEYEVPGTNFTLTITYGTTSLYQDAATNPGSYVHTEVWSWFVDANLFTMARELELFHEIAEGTNEVPLVSDEVLYAALQAKIAEIVADINLGTPEGKFLAGMTLVDFENEISDRIITVSPPTPAPTGDSTGVIQTAENPAAAKLLVDAEYVGKAAGIWFQVKK